MEDRQIVELYLARDESALARTAEKYGPALRALGFCPRFAPSSLAARFSALLIQQIRDTVSIQTFFLHDERYSTCINVTATGTHH